MAMLSTAAGAAEASGLLIDAPTMLRATSTTFLAALDRSKPIDRELPDFLALHIASLLSRACLSKSS